MSDIYNKFTENVLLNPDKVAIICEDKSMKYIQLYNCVNKWSLFFKKNGVVKNDHIGVLLPNQIEFVALILVCAALEVAIVPLNPNLPSDFIKSSFRFSNVKHIVATASVIKKIDRKEFEFVDGLWLSVDKKMDSIPFLYDELEKIQIEDFEQLNTDENSALIFTLTSGSTGNPKPIVLTQKNKYDRAMSAIEIYSISNQDIILAATPLYHSLAERLVLIPLLCGATSVLMSRVSPILWLETVQRDKVTFTIAVSSQLCRILEELKKNIDFDLGSLRCVVSSSALLESSKKEELINLLECDFHECYGTSEVAVVTNLSLKDSKYKSVGKAIPNVDVKIIDDNEQEVDKFTNGEIICKTSLLFNGYYKLPEVTENAMLNGYFKTGDIGYLDNEGYLYYVGRKKDIIISGGINIYPCDIEDIVGQTEGVKECAAFPYKNNDLGEIVAVAIVETYKGSFSERKAKFYCAKKLAEYQQPRKYFIIDDLPRNSMGKLTKHKLVEIFTDDRKEGNSND